MTYREGVNIAPVINGCKSGYLGEQRKSSGKGEIKDSTSIS